jgi:hypothetical protein
VSDVSPVAELDALQVLDLESNAVSDPDAADYLGMCPTLTTLSLEGNPVSHRMYYRRLVARAIPLLEVLDDRTLDDADRAELPAGAEDAGALAGAEGAGGNAGGGAGGGTAGVGAGGGAEEGSPGASTNEDGITLYKVGRCSLTQSNPR